MAGRTRTRTGRPSTASARPLARGLALALAWALLPGCVSMREDPSAARARRQAERGMDEAAPSRAERGMDEAAPSRAERGVTGTSAAATEGDALATEGDEPARAPTGQRIPNVAKKARPAELEQLEFENPLPLILAPIELCLPPALRKREWNVSTRPYRVTFGERTTRNFERLVKRLFADVAVSFDADCGSQTDRPWITLEIVSARRDRYREVENDQQRTSVRLRTTLHADDGRLLWSEEVLAEVAHPRALNGAAPAPEVYLGGALTVIAFPIAVPIRLTQSVLHARAARDFGEALGQGLDRLFDAMVRSAPLRRALDPADPPAGGRADTLG